MLILNGKFIISSLIVFYRPAEAFESKIINVTSSTVIKYGNQIILVDSSGGDVTLTLPSIGNGSLQAGDGYEIYIKDVAYSASQHTIFVTSTGSDKIDNDTTGASIEDNGGFLTLKSNTASKNWLESGTNKIRRPNQIFAIPFSNNIDGKTIGTTNVFKVPQGKKVVFLGADIALRTKTGTVTAVGSGKFKVAGGSDLTLDTAMTGITSVGDVTHFPAFQAGTGSGTVITGGMGGTQVQFNLSVPFTVTNANLSGSIIGYMLN